MKAEISFDLVMSDNMPFVEGTYRLPGRDWEVVIFGPDDTVGEPVVITTGHWESGVTGTFVKWPPSRRLNKSVVLSVLSNTLGVTQWEEVQGPDSMQLR